ncbi:MAG TPA: NAD(P)/FAD-dependent oxidoreductase [Epulopiscium sp.]|nr:NAD(P)/FAD-dependent oxidoreductase [Candidatus Epulonipiscium sp.]
MEITIYIRSGFVLDIAIIGAGPAGLSAGINGVIRNKKVQVIGKNPNTSYLYKAEKVDNYLGIHDVTGPEMVDQFVKHALDMGVEIVEGRVLEIFPMGDYYALNVNNNFIEAKTVIIANGLGKAKSMPGEKEFLGKGVSYCATCDGMLYRDKTVILIGETEEAEEDANYLQEVTEKAYYIPLYKDIKNVHKDVEILRGKPKKVFGEQVVAGLTLDDIDIEAQGVFIAKETTPISQILGGLELEKNSIKVSRQMETNMPGIYAAGDCTGRPYQVSKAVGEGVVAALQAVSYLHKMGIKVTK